ncbi:hypothetical protein [Nocardioides daphniae]|uniref:Uncharacterized protein n=1 Tax=Nocardioides daphniae TaxID=402297 RepID=A0ABQ1Q626_9ACTN|nr:hypothetical protein [Nocardioides daphniae]GGD12844.1 hypothetical protein GCM10007231_09830 [Nocardioides daphniae]
MEVPSRLAALVGLVATGVLALTEQFDAVPTALAASAGAWWILRGTPA